MDHTLAGEGSGVGQHVGRKYLQGLKEGEWGQEVSPNKRCRKYVVELDYGGRGRNGWS